MSNDAALLRRYADGDEAAFRELVERHLPLVYSTALRQVGGDCAVAEDVTQSVFADFAARARELEAGCLIAGWLYRATRFAAAKVVRSEQRRRVRELAFHQDQELRKNPIAAEDVVDPDELNLHLDAVINELSEQDRDAIILRFFQGLDFRAVGAALQTSDDTAQKRVGRALEKLRMLLGQRGVALSVGALTVLLTGCTAAAKPPLGLAEHFAKEVGAAGRRGIISIPPAKAAVVAGLMACIGLVFVAGSYYNRSNVTPGGLVSWWTGDGTANDSVGRNNGTLQGNVTYAPGIRGTAFHFDGNEGTRVLVPDSPSLNFTNEFTVECWFRPDADSNMGMLLTKRAEDRSTTRTGNPANFGLHLAPIDTVPQWGISQMFNDTTLRGDYHLSRPADGGYVTRRNVFEQLAFFPTEVDDLSMLRGQWHHLAGTFKQLGDEQVEMTIFFDGNRRGRLAVAGRLARSVTDAPLSIGGFDSVWFKGCLDEIRIYNRAITDQEILNSAKLPSTSVR